MPSKTIITAAAGVVAATGIVITVASLANASTSTSPTSVAGYAGYGQQSGDDRGPGGGTHTAVTGTELAKVTAAVRAKDSAVTVMSVRKDEDGSYDVFGTRAGARVMFDVSKDLKTITARTGGPGEGRGRHGGGPGGGAHTAVTGTELAKVTAAVRAKDATVTVTSVRKDEDGSYDAFGTKAGARVTFDVSKDLKTITARTGGPGGHGHGHEHGPDGGGPGAPGGSSTQSNGTQSNGTASTTAFRTV